MWGCGKEEAMRTAFRGRSGLILLVHLACAVAQASGEEVCSNDRDDDLDGSVDCGDSDCVAAADCQVADPGMGPLKIGPARYYFQRPDGRGILLVGSHTWG